MRIVTCLRHLGVANEMGRFDGFPGVVDPEAVSFEHLLVVNGN
jgi:hypothetical protein